MTELLMQMFCIKNGTHGTSFVSFNYTTRVLSYFFEITSARDSVLIYEVCCCNTTHSNGDLIFLYINKINIVQWSLMLLTKWFTCVCSQLHLLILYTYAFISVYTQFVTRWMHITVFESGFRRLTYASDSHPVSSARCFTFQLIQHLKHIDF